MRFPSPPTRARWIAFGFFVVWLLVMLAGSDIPPPLGFVWVVVGLVVFCTAMAFAIPWLWRVRADRDIFAVVWRTTTIGALTGLALAAIFAAPGSGEPSIPPLDAADYAIWFLVVTGAGALNGIIVGLIVSWLRPSSSP